MAAADYRPYETLVREAARIGRTQRSICASPSQRIGPRLAPWPGVIPTLEFALACTHRLGIVTNCSEQLGRRGGGPRRRAVRFSVVVTSERAGIYKPDPRPYRTCDRMSSVFRLTACPVRCRFGLRPLRHFQGQGSTPIGTTAIGLTAPAEAPRPLIESRARWRNFRHWQCARSETGFTRIRSQRARNPRNLRPASPTADESNRYS